MKTISFEEQIDQVKEKLYRYAFCYVKNEQDALEIVSETIYKAYLSYHKLKHKNYFETWITRITINCALDFIRNSKKTVSMENFPELRIEEPPVSMEEKYDLYEALNTLDEENKAFIILKFFEEKSFREIAEIYQMPEGTVKTRVYRILKDLRYTLVKGGTNY